MDDITKIFMDFEEKINRFSRIMKEFVESEEIKKLKFYSETISNLQKLGKDYNWVIINDTTLQLYK